MNGPEDCGKTQGDAKGLTGLSINQWKFEGMAGNGQILDCTPAPLPGAKQCEISSPGSKITFNYAVSNQGCVRHDVTLTDDKLGDVGGGLFNLAKGETSNFVTKVADISNNYYQRGDGGRAAGRRPGLSGTDSATVTVKEPCVVCKGGTFSLSLQYLGTGAADVKIYDDPGAKADKILFQGPVVSGQVITLTPWPGQTKLANDVSILIGGVLNAKIKTDCTQPIGPNAIYGDFKVTRAVSPRPGTAPSPWTRVATHTAALSRGPALYSTRAKGWPGGPAPPSPSRRSPFFPGATIKAWYMDEHALTLGVRQVAVNGVMTFYPVTALSSNPGDAAHLAGRHHCADRQSSGHGPLGAAHVACPLYHGRHRRPHQHRR